MRNLLNIRKARAAAAYVVDKNGGAMNIIYLVKILYWAERSALLGWHRPIIGDNLCSLQKGPIVSLSYNLMNGKGDRNAVNSWQQEFLPRTGNIIERRNPEQTPDIGPLSRRELNALDQAYVELANLSEEDLIAKMHTLPEWKDPKSSSLPISYNQILSESLQQSEEEVAEIVSEIESVQCAHLSLGLSPAK